MCARSASCVRALSVLRARAQRAPCSAPRAWQDLFLNFFNNGRDWAEWMSQHAHVLGAQVVAELHIYHAFDPPFGSGLPFVPTACPMCTDGAHGSESAAQTMTPHSTASVRARPVSRLLTRSDRVLNLVM